ncbi:MAG: MBL fold metallo-hydrolase [Acidobacteria bacterium]|nr:MBL fold metallo-hydrolase [Acidobacteriota bacterium]
MVFKIYVEGPLQVNTFLVADENHPDKPAAIIDPAGKAKEMVKFIEENGLKPVYIINTHGHIDHIAYNRKFKELYPETELLIHKEDEEMFGMKEDPALVLLVGGAASPKPDRLLFDGDVIEIGSIKLEIIHTPGHTKGGICLLNREAGWMITGDTLFYSGIGRTDLHGGSYEDLIRSIRDKLMPLDDDIVIYPGHGESSTIGEERENNPFLQL